MRTSTDGSDTGTVETDSPGITRFQRFLAASLVVATLLAVTYVVRQAPITMVTYRQFETFASRGNRVEFDGVLDRTHTRYDVVTFRGHPIIVQTKSGPAKWSPDPGQRCRVTGNLERFGRPVAWSDAVIEYRVKNAVYSALPTR